MPNPSPTLRVLMFGWEFPPFQAGGLATATLGLVKGLLNQGLEVTLVVPFPVQGSALPRRQVIERYGIPAEKVDVVHWGIDQPDAPADLPEPPIIEGRPTVLFLGRVTRQKGPEYFVELAAQVRRFVPDAEFIMAGTGDLLRSCIERSVELGLTGAFHFAGPLSGVDVHRAFRAADVCVMTSVSEPFGLVALESLRNGTPVIVPSDSGVAEVLRHCFKADFWDTERMADQIVALLRHPELWQELQESAAAEIRHPRFGLEEPARLTATAYQRTVTPRRKR